MTTPSHNKGKATFALLCAALLCTLLPSRQLASAPHTASQLETTDRQTEQSLVAEQYASLPMRFEPNVGQTDESVQFLSRGSGYTLFLTSDESVMVLGRRAVGTTPDGQAQRDNKTAVLRTRLEGASSKPEVEGLDPLPGITNYFIGNDPEKWHTDIVSFSKVRYSEVYPGIDLMYYGNERNVEYDFVVSPGTDPSAIRFSITGADRLSVNESGELVLEVEGGELRQQAPVIYQEGALGKETVDGAYVVHGDVVSFALGSYDLSRELVIDPVLVYSTYLGGSGLDQATSIYVGTTGDAYVAGNTMSANFPIQGTPSSTFGGVQDVFVTKMSLAGSGLTYSTYVGSPGTDIANDIFVTSAGVAHVTGSTNAIGFPVVTPTIASYQGNTDAFLFALTAAGNAIAHSTYWGGTGFEEGTGVTVDPTDAPYITGNTTAPDFPTQTPFQAALSGGTGQDAFMTKFSVSPGSIVYSTYLGGFGNDRAFDIAVRDNASVLVTGSTTSSNFPTTPTSVQPALAGNRDAFLTNFSLAGNALDYSTYLGGSGDDEAFGIILDQPGSAYLTGRTSSTNFPTMGPAQLLYGGGANDAFAAKISAAGSALLYSTYLGGAGDDQGQGIDIDGSANAFVTGSTTSANFPTLFPLQASLNGVSDAFVTKLNLAGNALIYSTYLGGSSADEGQGVGVDLVGSAYVAGFTESTNFPTLNPFQAAFGGVRDAFVTKIADGTPGRGRDTVGAYDGATGVWYLRNTNDSGPANFQYGYGPAGLSWTPIKGDWDGDGDDTAGLYNPATSVFYLKNSHTGGVADIQFGYGAGGLGWRPIVGDWDNDGDDTVGLYSPSTGVFYLRNSNSGGPADVQFGYGPAGLGWVPLAGNWDGIGSDTVGLYAPSSGVWYLRNSNTGGPADFQFGYGPGGLGWIPLAGDYDNDGMDTPGLYAPSTAVFYLKNANAGGPADLQFQYGAPNWTPLIGDWDGQ